MKIFKKGDKVNFVDKNNVFVGYDLSQDCCENADWFLADKKTEYVYDEKFKQDLDVEAYTFDTNYFQQEGGGHLDGGEMAVFRLVAEGKPDLFLHIFNSHNGYYGHGFEASINGVKWQDGIL